MKKLEKRGCPFGIVLFAILILVLWNSAWYLVTTAKLSARFHGKAISHQNSDTAKYRYVFHKNYGLSTNASDEFDHVNLALARFLLRGYDPNGVLSDAYGIFNRLDSDVEISVETCSDRLTMTFSPSEKLEHQHYTFEKTYQIGKDCIACGRNAFSFRHVDVSGGYGMGLLISEVISKIVYDEYALIYDITRSYYGLGFFLVPIARENEDCTRFVLEHKARQSGGL